MAVIACDLDGVINDNPNSAWVIFVRSLLFLARPQNKAREALALLAREHTLWVVTARPAWAYPLTWLWLKLYQVPFDKIVCAGIGSDKVEVLRKAGAAIHIDNCPKTCQALRRAGFKVCFFTNWNQVLDFVGCGVK